MPLQASRRTRTLLSQLTSRLRSYRPTNRLRPAQFDNPVQTTPRFATSLIASTRTLPSRATYQGLATPHRTTPTQITLHSTRKIFSISHTSIHPHPLLLSRPSPSSPLPKGTQSFSTPHRDYPLHYPTLPPHSSNSSSSLPSPPWSPSFTSRAHRRNSSLGNDSARLVITGCYMPLCFGRFLGERLRFLFL